MTTATASERQVGRIVAFMTAILFTSIAFLHAL